jgi:putative membrane protein
MNRTGILATAAIVALSMGAATAAHAQNNMAPNAKVSASASVKPSSSTKSFIKDASEANLFEIESSKVALTKASNQKVKDFAQKMIDDHTKAGEAMKDAIGTNTAEQADVETSLSMMHKLKVEKLDKLDTTSFDKDYVNAQVDAHKDAVKLFSKYAEQGDDESLKNFAAATLPTLQDHLRMINDIKAEMKIQTSMK